MSTFTFPVGYHDLHKTKIIDFQLNRWYSLGYARLKDMEEAVEISNYIAPEHQRFERLERGDGQFGR